MTWCCIYCKTIPTLSLVKGEGYLRQRFPEFGVALELTVKKFPLVLVPEPSCPSLAARPGQATESCWIAGECKAGASPPHPVLQAPPSSVLMQRNSESSQLWTHHARSQMEGAWVFFSRREAPCRSRMLTLTLMWMRDKYNTGNSSNTKIYFFRN